MVKGLVRNMKTKRIDVKLFLTILILIIFESLLFFLTKPFIHSPNILNTKLDNAMPYISYFVYPYILWYIMLMVVPYFTYTKSKESFYKYATTYIISTIISALIFVVFPNGVIRPEIVDTSFSSKLVKILYTLDTPSINCLPSIHCLYAFLFLLSAIDTKDKTTVFYKIIIFVLTIFIVLATMFIKQHVLLDAIVAFAISLLTWIIVDRFKLYEFFKKYIMEKINL